VYNLFALQHVNTYIVCACSHTDILHMYE